MVALLSLYYNHNTVLSFIRSKRPLYQREENTEQDLLYDRWKYLLSVSSVGPVMSNSLWPLGLQHNSPPCPSPNPGVYPNSCPLSQWCHPTIASSIVPFSSCFQSFLASGSFPMSQFFASSGQSIRVSASLSVLPMNIQDWFPLWWAGFISLQSKGPWRVFSNTAVQKHQFFSAQPSSQSNSHIYIWLQEKP